MRTRFPGRALSRPSSRRMSRPSDCDETRCRRTHCKHCITSCAPLTGEQYECFLPSPTCGKAFRTLKGRRLHLTSKHGYPEEFFFAVVLYGIERRAKRGQGLLRDKWQGPDSASDKSRSLSPFEIKPTSTVTQTEQAQQQDVDDLAATFSSSVSLVPRAVRQKQKSAAAAATMDTQA